MKALAALLALIAVLCLLGFAWFVGFAMGLKTKAGEILAKAGFTKNSWKLYLRAGKIMARVRNRQGLDGAMSLDVLSEQSAALIDAWLAEHEKELNKT